MLHPKGGLTQWAKRLWRRQLLNYQLPGFRPNTYLKIAAALRAMGRDADAEQLEIESRDIERRHASWPKFLWLTALRATIGYGIGLRYFRITYWVVLLTAICAAVGADDAQRYHTSLVGKGRAWWMAASFDHIVPVVSFTKDYDDLLGVEPTAPTPRARTRRDGPCIRGRSGAERPQVPRSRPRLPDPWRVGASGLPCCKHHGLAVRGRAGGGAERPDAAAANGGLSLRPPAPCSPACVRAGPGEPCAAGCSWASLRPVRLRRCRRSPVRASGVSGA